MVNFTSLFVLVVSCIQLAYSIVSLQGVSELIRVFGRPPNPVNKGQAIHRILVPKACRHKNYCTIKPKNYPQELFNKLFENKTVIAQPSMYSVDPNLMSRGGEDEIYDTCEAKTKTVPLFVVKDEITREWLYVVQSPKHNYSQYVHTVSCINKNAKCVPGTGLPNFVSYCKETNVQVSLLVTDGKKMTKTKNIELPACCSCAMRRSLF